jgi:RimJ/RimL family protein N-acetyltransferase
LITEPRFFWHGSGTPPPELRSLACRRQWWGVVCWIAPIRNVRARGARFRRSQGHRHEFRPVAIIAGAHINTHSILGRIVPEMRGRGAGAASQRQLVDYLFSTTKAHRIWAGTEVENVAEQRALERCGFTQEGRLRGTHFRAGQWRDSFIYGIVRDDVSVQR